MLFPAWKYLAFAITFQKKTHILFQLYSFNIKNKKFDSVFSFKKTTQMEVVKIIRDLTIRKSCQTSDIPTQVNKLNSVIFSNFVYKHFILSIW